MLLEKIIQGAQSSNGLDPMQDSRRLDWQPGTSEIIDEHALA
jgi:hypothetical protein